MRTVNIFISVFSIVIASAFAQEYDIYICLEGEFRPGAQMLVYTYIDGEKTACMPKNELLEYLDKRANPSLAAAPDKSEIVCQMRQVDSLKTEYRNTALNFRGADLRDRDFFKLNLQNADMEGADLRGADLRGANLKYANLKSADLSGAYLKGADMRNTDLTDAILKGAYFNCVDLRNVRGLSLEAVRVARTFYKAQFDYGMLEEIKICCQDKLEKAPWNWHGNLLAEKKLRKKNRTKKRDQE